MTRRPTDFANHPVKFPGDVFRAVCKHVVDGDTIDCLVDLGFNQYYYAVIRLNGVNTPELRGGTEMTRALAQQARDFTVASVLDQPVLLTVKPDVETFGRYVATVAFWDVNSNAWDLGGVLLTAGLAEQS